MVTIFISMENSNTSESQKFAFNLLQRLNLRSLNEYVAVQNFSVYETRKNIRSQNKSNKLKLIILTLNEEFNISKCSYSLSDIQDYIEYIIKKT